MSRNERRLAKKNKWAGGSRKAMPATTAHHLFNEALKAFQQGSFFDAALKADQLIASVPELFSKRVKCRAKFVRSL